MNPHIYKIQGDLGLKQDGKRGPITNAALLERADKGGLAVIDLPAGAVNPTKPFSAVGAAFASPSYSGMASVFGAAGGADCTAGRVALPFHFRLAWDLDQKVSIVSCHKKLASAFTGIWVDAAKHYGETEFRRLRLDLYGGCFNYRPMRGGSSLSTHAYGAAWDVDPERNQLKWDHNLASLSRSDYAPFWSIVEAYGAVSLGRAKNYDWMHFQFCKA